MSKPKSPKAATPALEAAVEAAVKPTTPPAEQAEKAPAPKTPRLSPALAAKADRIIATREKKKAPAARGARPPKAKNDDSEQDLVVFALRMSHEERELVHQAAGPAKASRFARALLVAAACHDEGAITLLLQNAQQATA